MYTIYIIRYYTQPYFVGKLRVALAEMFIVVLDNLKQPSEVLCKKYFPKEKPVTAFKTTTTLTRNSNTSVFLWNMWFFFLNIYFEEHLRVTAFRKHLHLQQYICFVKHLFVIFLVWFLHKYNFKSVYFRSSN